MLICYIAERADRFLNFHDKSKDAKIQCMPKPSSRIRKAPHKAV